MPKAMVAGSLSSRILGALGVCPATASGLAALLDATSADVGSALCRLQNSGHVLVYYTLREALARGIKIETGSARRYANASVYGLASSQLLAKARISGHKHHANAGLTAEIRELLAEVVELTVEEIAERLRRDLDPVRGAVHQMVRVGGVVARGSKAARTYRLFVRSTSRQTDADGSARIAGRITVGRGSRWWTNAGLV